MKCLHNKRNIPPRAGFATAEILAAAAILVVLAAIAIPSVLSFINYGKHQNRMNIARTIYLAAQSELTNRKVEKNLKSTLAGHYYEKTDGIYAAYPTVNINRNNVAAELGGSFPSADADNADYVHYISKPAGYTFKNDNSELDDFYTLLDGIIIDKEILNRAILMEYNIETGIVMSIFYGDAGQTIFAYGALRENDVSGTRGMGPGGYTSTAKIREQGYYGVGSTGELETISVTDIINIYDGADKPLAVAGAEKLNVLYAELLLAKPLNPDGTFAPGMPAYTVELEGTNIKCNIDFEYEALSGFDYSLSDEGLIYLNDTNPQVVQNGVNIGRYYKQYIWVIDYIDGDILTGIQPYNIGGTAAEPVNARAAAVRDGGTRVASLETANTHFYRSISGLFGGTTYEVKSARHLNNIRYVQDGDFRQTGHIDMQQPGNIITNFKPIEGFNGTYFAMKDETSQYRISNLVIDTARLTETPAGTGLFADIGPRGRITGILLFAARINAPGGNTGAIAGRLSGTVSQCAGYANVSAGTGANAGGLVGEIMPGGLVGQSFNAGFFNARSFTESIGGFGSVRVLGGNGGGLAGLNNGTVQNSFNNARINVDDIFYNEAEGLSYDPIYTTISAKTSLGGIAGSGSGSIINCYSTNFVSLVTDYGSISGGITGSGGVLKNCYFLANGSGGTGSLSKDELFSIPPGLNAAFNGGKLYYAGNNSYSQYPYPVLKNNAPFDENLIWGWEDILSFDIGAVELLYYEKYDDASFGYSLSTAALLAGASSGRTAVNDGYLLDFKFAQKLEIIIGGNTYTLNGVSELAPNWTWSGVPHARKFENIPIAYSTEAEGETVTRFRLFLENSVLESYAQGDSLINLTVVVLDDDEDPVQFYFNPLFANSVRDTNTAVSNYSVRSPRHMDNIDSALSSSFSQNMNIDFSFYRKELNPVAAAAEMDNITLDDSTGLVFDNSAVVANPFSGSYDGRNYYTQNAEVKIGLFNTVGAGGVVSSLILRGSSVSGHWEADTGVGGIAGVNNGTIIGCTVDSGGGFDNETVISGAYHIFVGGIAGINNAEITDCFVESAQITGARDIGGIAGINNAEITGCTVSSSQITGSWGGGNTEVGGIAGTNMNTISGSAVESNTIVIGQSVIGGVAGKNSAVITGCTVSSSQIYGNNGGSSHIGGIAGDCENGGVISGSGAIDSTIISDGTSAGGIVGVNSGKVSGVFFVSVNEISDPPVKSAGWGIAGGVAGENNGTVIHAIYLAPAPANTVGNITAIYPIVRDGTPSEKLGGYETCFYLSGHRYSLDKGSTWINDSYNFIKPDLSVVLHGGGRGMITDFVDVSWLNYAYMAGFAAEEWYQPAVGYPYPIPVGLPLPGSWPVTDSPARPDQEDRHDWEDTLPTSNRAANIGFINGDFDLPLMNPGNSSQTYNILLTDTITTAPGSQTGAGAVSAGGFNTSLNTGPGGVPAAASPPGTNSQNGSDYYGMYTYYNADYVQGWNTRPVSPGDAGNQYANYIEFQRPYSASLANSGRYGRVRTNYEGTLTGAYAELNAQIPGTLYQISPTIPGTELYYSFYHARRNAGNETAGNQKMNFYLSGMTDDNGTWVYTNGSRPTIIRPCITPRGNNSSQSNTRHTVVYGTTGSDAAEPVSITRVDFYDPKTGQTRNAYLYDVWVSGEASNSTARPASSAGGYGVTFWSDRQYAVGTATSQIPQYGVKDLVTAKSSGNANNAGQFYLPSALLNDAENNVIGYWDVRRFSDGNYSEWKQYYGLYTIPEGQFSTEFAYESASARNMQEGNYLDGITFQSPGFLSVEKYVKMGGTDVTITDDDVKFVKPGDNLTVFLAVKNWGEVSADSIIVTDQLSPYHAYLTYGGNIKINGASAPDGTVITAPDANNNYTLTVKLPVDTVLATYEELKISFDISINYIVSNIEDTTTLLYYFKNQAVVSYYDAGFAGYSITNPAITEKKNASGPGPAQVFIDPIKLSKTVTPLTDGPFLVELAVENTLTSSNAIMTTGQINDVIPADFVITDKSALPAGTSYTVLADGSARITIPSVNISDSNKKLTYQYTLSYTGRGYGVIRTGVSSDYKYLYNDISGTINVMLNFPQCLVGISVKTAGDEFEYDASSGTATYDILQNDSFSEKLSDDNYDVTPEVVLIDPSTGTDAQINTNGDYQINNDNYTAVLIKSTNGLQFTPKAGASGTFTFSYQIRLTAVKSGAAGFELDSPVTTVSVRPITN